MKKVIIKFEKDKNSLREFRNTSWVLSGCVPGSMCHPGGVGKQYEKVFVSPLWNFSKKNFTNGNLALDFRNLNPFEIPEFSELKKIKYFFVNSETKKILEIIKKSKKVIYSFSEEKNFEKELKTLFKKNKNTLEKDFQKFLNNIFLEINVDSYSEEELFKKIVFLKKNLLKVLDKKTAEKIKIILRNNFSLEINQKILENKLLKVDGIIME